MPNKNKLEYMVKLLDDENPDIRQKVIEDISLLGEDLEHEYDLIKKNLKPFERILIEKLILDNKKEIFLNEWLQLTEITNDLAKIEKVFSIISDFQFGKKTGITLSSMLDKLADDFLLKYPNGNVLELISFLFKEKGIYGDRGTYFNPYNSNMIYVIQQRIGIPITLCYLLILIGKRAGLRIEACNNPGHFLARIYLGKKIVLVDCYNGGNLIYAEDLKDMLITPPYYIEDILKTNPDTASIIFRIINNLVQAYKKNGNTDLANFFTGLVKDYF